MSTLTQSSQTAQCEIVLVSPELGWGDSFIVQSSSEPTKCLQVFNKSELCFLTLLSCNLKEKGEDPPILHEECDRLSEN